MNWIAGVFLAAVITISFAVYSDISMTKCAPGSFFAIIKMCDAKAR